MKKTAIFLVLVVLLIFFVIMMFTSALGDYFGKKAEMISLVAIAIALLVMLLLNNRDKGN
jgi:hypothetical protein